MWNIYIVLVLNLAVFAQEQSDQVPPALDVKKMLDSNSSESILANILLIQTTIAKEVEILRDRLTVFEHAFNRLSAVVFNVSSNQSTIDMLFPTEFDAHHNCIKGCSYRQGLPIDCSEAMEHNGTGDGIYLIKAPSNDLKPFAAYCKRLDHTEWTVIQRREDGSVNFQRNWKDYKNGFGNLSGEHWLGLERIHALTTNRQHELYIELTDFDDDTRFARYSKFSIAGDNENYKLSIDGHTGNVNHSMSINDGQEFSTFDKDNDKWKGGNCAQNNGGWWFYVCSYVNLNGIYMLRNPWNKPNNGIYWTGFHMFRSLKKTLMAIRPV